MLGADTTILYFHSDETREFRHELEVSSKHQNAPVVIWYFKTITAGESRSPYPTRLQRRAGWEDTRLRGEGDVEMVYDRRRRERESRWERRRKVPSSLEGRAPPLAVGRLRALV